MSGSPLALYTRRLATSEGRSQTIRSFTASFTQRVVGSTACEIAETLLDLLDVLLVGCGDLADLVWKVLGG
jgi:glutamyl-tRNA reductase